VPEVRQARITTSREARGAADERLNAQKLIRSRLTAAEVVAMPSQAERLAMRSRTG
jgi:hypothetical protein